MIRRFNFLKGVVFLLVFTGIFITSLYNYLLFHSIAEIFSIFIAFGIFMFAWNSRNFIENQYFMFIGIAYLFIGGIDLIHTLSYSGMGVFTGYGTNLPTQLWISARYMESITLLIAPFFITHKIDAGHVCAVYAGITALLLGAIFYVDIFPACFIEGSGLTPFKKISEYMISLILAGSLIYIINKQRVFHPYIFKLLAASILLTITSELVFTFYISAYDLSNMMGHFLKIISFYLIYKAVIETGLKQPYSILLREIKAGEAKLGRLNLELEKRVDERTSDLKKEIVEKEHIQKKLSRSHNLLKAVFEGISDVLLVVDADFSLKLYNNAALTYFNIDPDLLSDMSLPDLLYPDQETVDTCPACHAVRTGKYTIFEHQDFPDHNRIAQVTIYPIKTSEFTTSGAILRISDITKSRMLEKQMAHNEKLAAIGFLVAGIAHEINNPINFITFNLPILHDYLHLILPVMDTHAETHPDVDMFGMTYAEFREDIFKLLDNMGYGAKRVKTIISNLKTFSRTKNNKNKEFVDIHVMIDRSISICQGKIKKMVTSFETDIPDNLERVYTDSECIEQVLINMLINAAQASDKPDSWVKLNVIKGDTQEKNVIIEIKDNGCGMNDETRKKIFDPFFTTKPGGEGTGLGLYLCHNMIQSLGGHINVESKPGEGSTFRIVLPKITS